MKTKYLTAACILVESDESKVLFDPWLSETAFYGAWAHDPPIEPNWDELKDITAIVVSHIHQDHMDLETLKRLPRVPVLIPRFREIPMARILKNADLQVVELDWWKTVRHNDLLLTPLQPDAPELDSAWAIEHNDELVLNLVDCPAHALADIEKWLDGERPKELFMQYAASGPYPHCFMNLTNADKRLEKRRMIHRFLTSFADTVRRIQPERAIPFAVGYRLRGRLAHLNEFRPIPNRETLALRREFAGLPIDVPKEPWAHDGHLTVDRTRELLDWESAPWPHYAEPHTLFMDAIDEWRKRTEVPRGWRLVFRHGDRSEWAEDGYFWRHEFVLDARQFVALLDRRMHWDNALGSSQIMMSRQGPFDRALYRAMSYLHA